MTKVINDILDRYFRLLSSTGYLNYSSVYDILFLIAVEEFTSHDYDGYLDDSDYRSIQNAIYKIFGTHCIIPFPKHCCCMDSLHLSDVSYMRRDIEDLKDRMSDVENTKVVKTKEGDSWIEVDDVEIKHP